MPYQLVTEYCGRWWHFFWAGPNLYVHLVDVEGLPEDYCEVAQPGNLLGLRRGSIPVACVPLVYRAGEDVWVVAGNRNHHYYRRADRLAKVLEKNVETWPYWCSWTPVGRVPPSVYDVELLAEALLKMPVYKPPPEELAIDFVAWSYEKDVSNFLHSEYIHLVRSSRAEERWREICPEGDPRQCYPGALGEILASLKEQGKTPAVDSTVFGARFARPWGAPPVYLRNGARVYYVLGHVLREVVQRKVMEQADVEIPILPVADYIDVQGPIMRRERRRKPTPSAPIASIEDFPTSGDVKGGPLAVFDFLDDL